MKYSNFGATQKNGEFHIKGLVTVKHAADMLGYKSRNSIRRLAEKGLVRYVVVSYGTSSEIKLYFAEDLEKLLV